MPRPAFTLEQATALAAEHFGLASPEATALPSYDDQNFRVAAGGGGYVLKVAAAGAECRGFCDAAATRGMLEMENTAMRRIAEVGVAVPTPVSGVAGGEIVQLEQLGGACEEAGTCFVRLITFLPGTLLAEVPEHPPCLLRRFGTCLGRMDQALADFSHEHAVRDLTWDLANASRARQHFADIADPADRELAARALGRFDSLVVPALGRLPRQVVHGDANDYNVLVDSAALAPPAAGAEADVSRIDMASLELASPHWSAQASAGGARHSSVNEGGGSAEALPAAVSRPLARKLSEMRTAPHEEVDGPAAEVGVSAEAEAEPEAEAAPAEVKAPREAAVEPEKEAAPAAEGSPPLLKPPPVRRVSLVVPAAGATKTRPRGAAAGFAARLRRSSAKSSAPRGRTFKAPSTPRSERVGDAPEALPMPGRAVETAGSLLPLARALHFEHPLELEEEAAAQRQRHLCFKLLATWEELAELQEQHLFWTSERLHANPAARLKGLIHAIVGSRRAADGAAPTSDEVSIEIHV